jgi:hypothetical protein
VRADVEDRRGNLRAEIPIPLEFRVDGNLRLPLVVINLQDRRRGNRPMGVKGVHTQRAVECLDVDIKFRRLLPRGRV